MATQQRRAGIIYFKVDGIQYDAKGNFTYAPNFEKKTAIVGADGIHGFAGEQVPPYIEGAVTDAPDLVLATLGAVEDATVTLELANGKVFMLRNAWYAGDLNPSTEQGEIPVRFEGKTGEETS